jgi:hypothetical protein
VRSELPRIDGEPAGDPEVPVRVAVEIGFAEDPRQANEEERGGDGEERAARADARGRHRG